MRLIQFPTLVTLGVVLVVLVALTAVPQVSGEATEQRRRPLFRGRTKPSTTSEPSATIGLTSDASSDSEGSETKGHQRSDPFSLVTGNQQPASQSVVSGGGFKPDSGDKLTSFSEYSFGSHAKLLPSPGTGSLEEPNPDDIETSSGYAGFKNHKSVGGGASSLLPTTNANKGKPADRGAFDFLARDYAKAKGSFGAGAGTGGIQHDTSSSGGLGLGTKSKSSSSSLSSSLSSKFSIGASGSGSKAAGKLAHLDDSTEYDVYAGLGQSVAGKPKLGASSKYRPASSGSTFGAAAAASSPSSSASASLFDGKVKKVPFKYEDGGFGAALKGGTKTKSKLALDDDNPLGGFDGGAYGGKHQQQQSLLGTKSKFNFAEPPALVKSTLSTLKHFGDGLLGNGNGNGALFHSQPNPYELDSDEGGGLVGAVAAAPGGGHSGFHGGVTGGGGGKFGGSHLGGGGHHLHGFGYGAAAAAAGQQPSVVAEESYEVVGSSGELGRKPYPHHQHHQQLAKPPSSLAGGGGKFATDFDVKNIKLTGDGGTVFGGLGTGSSSSSTKYQQHPHHHQGKNTPPHHTKQQQHLGHLGGQHSATGNGPQLLQHHQHQLHQQHAPHHAHAPTHATGSIDNPNPLDFRPHFQLQDVPNLYPPAHGAPSLLGAGIAAKGQIESFLNAEHGALKDGESLVAQLLGQQQSEQPAGAGGRPLYHTLQKSKEEEQLEKEALRQQIEYLKAQAAKRPVDLAASNPARPAIVSNAQKFRPVRRIPTHVRLGVKAPYPLPRIPHYNDRPYSISFKI